ncbi:hypothetical protein D3C75_456130 [compost metagenome]
MLFQPAGHFAVGATVREHPDGCASRIAIRRGIGMYRDQEIGILLARHVRAAHHRQEIVTVAGQDTFKHRIVIQQRSQLTGNRDGHVFLTRATRADRTGIVAAMSGVDGNNHFLAVHRTRLRRRTRHRIAAGDAGNAIAPGFKRVTRGLARTRRHNRCFYPLRHYRWWRWRRWGIGVNGKNHHVIRTILLLHRPGFAVLRQVNHQSQGLIVFCRAGTNAAHQIIAAELERQTLDDARLFDIQRHAALIVL